jgi:hypothetical protein
MRFTTDLKRKERTAVGRVFLQPHNVIKVYKMFCVSVCNISYQIILLCTKRKIENPPRRFPRCLARWFPVWALRPLIFFRRSSFISQRERTVSRWGEAIHPVPTDGKRKSNSAKKKAETVSWSAGDPGILKDTNGLATLIVGCSLNESCNINAWYRDHVSLPAYRCFHISENTERISIKFDTGSVYWKRMREFTYNVSDRELKRLERTRTDREKWKLELGRY